ncbi:MAG: DUF5711 family protein [Eubacteriales bacterium]|nr:DUF5711 family protein [Eubacteriales bacterium]
MAIALVLLIVFLWQLPSSREYQADVNSEAIDRLEKVLSFSYDETRNLELSEERILGLHADHFRFMNLDGIELGEENLNLKELGYRKFNSGLIFGDTAEAGNNVYYYEADKLCWSSPLSGVFAGAVKGKDEIAVIDNPDKSYPSLHLLRLTDGNRIYSLSFAESGYISDVQFTPDFQALDVLLINTKKNELQAIIKRYDLQGGQMSQYTPLTKGRFYHSLAYMGSKLVLASDEAILLIDREADEAETELKYDAVYKLISRNNSVIALVRKEAGRAQELVEITPDAGEKQLLKLDSRVQVISEHNTQLFIAAGRRLYIYNLARGEIQAEVKLGDEAMALSFGSDGIVYLLTATGVHKLILS